MTWGINNWHPRWSQSTEDLQADAESQLRRLIGMKLVRGWLLWDVEADEWWNDAPVVLEFEHSSVEVCVNKMTDLSITCDQIATDQTVEWVGCEDVKLGWRPSASLKIRAVEGKTLDRVHVVEHPPSLPGILDGWSLIAVEFDFADGFLGVNNGLDEHLLEDRPLEGNDYRRSATIP